MSVADSHEAIADPLSAKETVPLLSVGLTVAVYVTCCPVADGLVEEVTDTDVEGRPVPIAPSGHCVPSP